MLSLYYKIYKHYIDIDMNEELMAKLRKRQELAGGAVIENEPKKTNEPVV